MNKIYLLLLVLLPGLTLFAQSGRLEYLDVYNLEYVSDPQISPDGRKVIYVRNYKDVMTDKGYSNLWVVNFDGSENRPLTTGNQSDYSPLWSPQGGRIVYKSNKDGSTQLYLHWIESGAETKLTNFPQSPGDFVLSTDGKKILFNMFVPGKSEKFAHMPEKPEGAKWNDPPKYIDDMNYRYDGSGYKKKGNTQLFILSTDGGTPRQITFEEYDHRGFEWSHAGNRVFFTANLREDHEYEPLNTEIYELDLLNLNVNPLTDRFGPDTNPRISPDGTKIAYLGLDDHYMGYQLTRGYIMNTDGKDKQEINTGLDRSIDDIQWDNDDKGIYFTYDDNGNTKIGYAGLNGKFKLIAENVGGTSLGRPYSSGSYSVSDNGRVSYTYTTPEHPADLMVVDEKSIKNRLTRLNDDLFSFKKTGEVEEIWYESSYDQRRIQGWICKPPDFDPAKKYPLILEIHGGPFANYGDRFSIEMQLYASEGYVVLYTNPRGSTSYGEEFGNLIHHNYPSQDFDDLMSGVDEIIKRGYVDENNLFVTGGSGGGILTAWIVGKTDRFRAAVAAKPVINWYSFSLYSDGPAFFNKYWFDKFPWEDPEQYIKRSPISLVDNVSTPTMLLTGEEDYRTPIAETEQFYAALKLKKVETAMVRIPGASHGIAARPSNLIAKVVYIIQWFDNHKVD